MGVDIAGIPIEVLPPIQILQPLQEVNEDLYATGSYQDIVAKRNIELQNGFTTTDGMLHFNIDTAKEFGIKLGSIRNINGYEVVWQNVDGDVVHIPLEKASCYLAEILNNIDNMYFGI
jgi:hypothetical protein